MRYPILLLFKKSLHRGIAYKDTLGKKGEEFIVEDYG